MKQTDYKVFSDLSILGLNETVKAAMKDGWVCQGGVYVFQRNPNTTPQLMQAMVREEGDPL